jgi:hypothetical protein
MERTDSDARPGVPAPGREAAGPEDARRALADASAQVFDR